MLWPMFGDQAVARRPEVVVKASCRCVRATKTKTLGNGDRESAQRAQICGILTYFVSLHQLSHQDWRDRDTSELGSHVTQHEWSRHTSSFRIVTSIFSTMHG